LAAFDPLLPDGFAAEVEDDESFEADDEDSFAAAAGALSFAAPEPFDEPSEAEAALRLSVR
jgi:hypothetical protein